MDNQGRCDRGALGPKTSPKDSGTDKIVEKMERRLEIVGLGLELIEGCHAIVKWPLGKNIKYKWMNPQKGCSKVTFYQLFF